MSDFLRSNSLSNVEYPSLRLPLMLLIVPQVKTAPSLLLQSLGHANLGVFLYDIPFSSVASALEQQLR